MIVEIDLHGEGTQARLAEPDDFKGFKVVLRQAGPSVADRLAAVGVARLDEHAWVRIDALRTLAGASATPEWEDSLASMLEFARSRDWVDDELGAIRAHVERI
jgi:hypothetical protein